MNGRTGVRMKDELFEELLCIPDRGRTDEAEQP